VKTQTYSSSRAFAIAVMAMIVFAMQTLGVAHRTSHARHAAPANELWLAVANGEVVSADVWNAQHASHASATHETNDPWHHHETRVDCERFDALCAGDAPVAMLLPALPLPDTKANTARTYRALISARTARAQARAPPLA
jgi:hypothetical protein